MLISTLTSCATTLRRSQPDRWSSRRSATKFDPQLVAEFTSRGITEKKALELLANLKPGQDVVAQLEHADTWSSMPLPDPSIHPASSSVSSKATPRFPRASRQVRNAKRGRRTNGKNASARPPKMPGSNSNRNTTITARGKPTAISRQPADSKPIKDAKRKRNVPGNKFPPEMIESMAAHDARSAIQKAGHPTRHSRNSWSGNSRVLIFL